MVEPVSFTSPFVRPVNYKTGPKGGFILFPHSDDVPEGWGDPTKDADGEPIVPGTEGGPNPNRYLAYKDEWKSYRSPGWQVAGPIDWKGPLTIPDNDTSKRWVLSYWGPNSRHFNLGHFEYGSDPKHQEIYVNGKLLAIAPYPVLGAAIKKMTYEKEEGGVTITVTENWLVAILKFNDDDECWVRKMPNAIIYSALTDELRESMVETVSAANPDGWQFIGSLPAQLNAYTPDTPWFFNESCTEARTVRRFTKTFDDGSGSNVTEDVYIEYMVRITVELDFKTALFTNLGLDPTHGFYYSEKTEKYQESWLFEDDPAEEWQEDIIEAEVKCDGKILIAVDYKGNELLKGYILQQAVRRYQYYYMLGVGTANSGRLDGEPVPRTANSKITGTTLPGDHETENWVSSTEDMTLHIFNVSSGVDVMKHKLQYIAALSQTMFSTGIDSNADRILYFWEGLFTYPHFLDMRGPMLVARSDGVSNFYGGPGNWHKADVMKYEWMQVDASEHPYMGTDKQQGLRWYTYHYEDNYVYQTWTRTVMLTWPAEVSQSLTRLTYKGGWLDPNAGEVLYEPYIWDNMNSWYQTLEIAPKFRIWNLPHILGDAKGYRPNAVYGMDERGNAVAYFEYNDPQTDEEAIAYGLYPPGDMKTAMTYGEKFSPGGVV